MPNIVKNTTIIGLLDLIAPHSCRGCGRLGSILCDCCKNNIIKNTTNICPLCKTPKTTPTCPNCTNLPPIYIAGRKSELIGELIQDYKYHSIRAAARPLASILDQILPETTSSVIVPLPTISRHIRERGFDHTHLITKQFAKLRPHTEVQKLLIRAKDTIQVGADRSTRVTQASSAYTIAKNVIISPATTYILFDDVWTTGATMLSAVKKLQQAGAQNIIIAVLALSGQE